MDRRESLLRFVPYSRANRSTRYATEQVSEAQVRLDEAVEAKIGNKRLDRNVRDSARPIAHQASFIIRDLIEGIRIASKSSNGFPDSHEVPVRGNVILLSRSLSEQRANFGNAGRAEDELEAFLNQPFSVPSQTSGGVLVVTTFTPLFREGRLISSFPRVLINKENLLLKANLPISGAAVDLIGARRFISKPPRSM